MGRFTQLLGGAWHWPLYQCRLCARWPTAGMLCSACLQTPAHSQAALRCLGCALRLPVAADSATSPHYCGACLQQPAPMRWTFAAVDYAWPWQGLIRQWKFHEQPALAQVFAQRAAQVLAQTDARLGQSPLQLLHTQAAMLVPVPPTPARMRERGFDHIHLLAQALQKQTLGALPLVHALARLPDKSPAAAHGQSRKTRTQRMSAMRNAFMVPEPGRVAGQKVLLLDDVMTTGATVSSATDALLRAGAAQVSVLVFARTP